MGSKKVIKKIGIRKNCRNYSNITVINGTGRNDIDNIDINNYNNIGISDKVTAQITISTTDAMT